jgi:hypothetical protein
MAKKQTHEPIALPSQLSADDNAYLLVLKRQQDASAVAMNSFAAYLTPKYQLQQGDSVQPDGQIVRKG